MTDKLKTEDLTQTELQKEILFRKERTRNSMTMYSMISVVVLIGGTLLAAGLIEKEKMEAINLAFVAIGAYIGNVKDITAAFLGMEKTLPKTQ